MAQSRTSTEDPNNVLERCGPMALWSGQDLTKTGENNEKTNPQLIRTGRLRLRGFRWYRDVFEGIEVCRSTALPAVVCGQ